MANDDARGGADERKQPRSGGGSRADRAERARTEAEAEAKKASVIPGPRSHGGTSRASTEREQTEDRIRRRGPGPQDDAQASDREPPATSDDVERKD